MNMRIGVLKRDYGTSFKVYQSNVCEHLSGKGISFHSFRAGEAPADWDLIWTQGAPIVDTFRVLCSASCPIVTTIHGVNQFVLPVRQNADSLAEQLRWRIKKPVQRLFWRTIRGRIAAVITVSQHCGAGIQSAYGFASGKIQVIPHGFDRNIFNEAVTPYSHSAPYFLHVSSGKRVKNISRILESYSKLNPPNTDLLVVAPGYRGPVPTEAGIHFTGGARGASQQALARLYKGALGFIFPSYDESFGLPILEAMACGCPVITSDRSACPEVAGDAALYVDPHSTDQITAAMGRLLGDRQLQEGLKSKASARSSSFSWEKSAEEHAKVFRSVIDQNSPRMTSHKRQ